MEGKVATDRDERSNEGHSDEIAARTAAEVSFITGAGRGLGVDFASATPAAGRSRGRTVVNRRRRNHAEAATW
jgi:hypothetical protein